MASINNWTFSGDSPAAEVLNAWNFPAGDWHSSPDNWSIGLEPNCCQDIQISNLQEVTISGDHIGRGKTLIVEAGAELEVLLLAGLDIKGN